MTTKKNIPPPPTPNRDFTAAAREEVLKRVEQDYEEFKKDKDVPVPDVAVRASEGQAVQGGGGRLPALWRQGLGGI